MRGEQANTGSGAADQRIYAWLGPLPLPAWILLASSLLSAALATSLLGPGAHSVPQHTLLRTPERAAERFLNALRDMDSERIARVFDGERIPQTPSWLATATGAMDLQLTEAHRMEQDQALLLRGRVDVGNTSKAVELEVREDRERGHVITAVRWADLE